MAAASRARYAAPTSTAATDAVDAIRSLASWNPRRWQFTHFQAGALAGVTASVITCPLEVMKTRMQVTNAGSNVFRFGANVIRNEGVRALWKGVGPTVVGVASGRALHFHLYQFAQIKYGEQMPKGSVLHLVAAGTAGAVVATTFCPLWVIKTRLQIQTNAAQVTRNGRTLRSYRGVVDAARSIVAEEGYRGFYRGLSASLLGVTEGALQFMIYQTIKTNAKDQGMEMDSFQTFWAAAAAKLTASALTYPNEVVRTRLRDRVAAVDVAGPKYTGLVQCFRTVVREEGLRALYSGMGPHLMRVVPNAAILFVVVEFLLERSNKTL